MDCLACTVVIAVARVKFSAVSASCRDTAAREECFFAVFGADCDFGPAMRLRFIGRGDPDKEAVLVCEDCLRRLGDFVSPCRDVLDAVFVVWTSLVHADDVVLGLE